MTRARCGGEGLRGLVVLPPVVSDTSEDRGAALGSGRGVRGTRYRMTKATE